MTVGAPHDPRSTFGPRSGRMDRGVADVSPSTRLSRERAQDAAMRKLLEQVIADYEKLARENALLRKPFEARAVRLRSRLQGMPRWKE